jgi:tetratricopeptide (TPR) repeat protein
LGVEQALLDRGASQLAAGRRDEAMALLRSLQTESLRGVSYHKKDSTPETEGLFALVGYHSSALMGDSERESGEFLAAVEDYDAASELVPVLEEAGAAGYRVERVHNNKAVTELALGRLESAEEAVRQALQVDRMNPAFLMTAAAVADAASDTASAADFNARALESDPGAYPAANNEGVQLARLGRDDDAEIAFRRSIGANPDYALGWFNLGVLQSRMGPSRLLASQGALARAFALDSALADGERELTIDTNTYRTGLDLSKPLPPGWSFADVQRVSPTASAGVLALVLFAFALARATGRGRGVELAEKWLGPVAEQLARMPVLGRLRAPAWALGVTVLLLSLPAIRHPSVGFFSIVAGALGVGTLAVVATRARGIAASRSGVELTQESWTPGLVFGLGTGLVGAPWAPLPVARPGRRQWRVHAAAPVTLALIAVMLFVEAAWLDVPITRSWAIAALIMTASTLLPVEPLDGAHLGKRGLVASAGVVVGAILVALGVA